MAFRVYLQIVTVHNRCASSTRTNSSSALNFNDRFSLTLNLTCTFVNVNQNFGIALEICKNCDFSEIRPMKWIEL